MTESVRDCHYPWTWMVVTADGGVMPCCFTSGQLGNLYEASADEIWNGDIARELRKSIVSGNIHPICADAPCKFVQNMRTQEKMVSLVLQESFDNAWYIEAYPDVASAVLEGRFKSAWHHFDLHGREEGRQARIANLVTATS